MLQRTLFGPALERFEDLTDASFVEAVPLALLVISIVAVGVYPSILTDVFNNGLEPMVSAINELVGAEVAVGQ